VCTGTLVLLDSIKATMDNINANTATAAATAEYTVRVHVFQLCSDFDKYDESLFFIQSDTFITMIKEQNKCHVIARFYFSN
jgi:hypothetical protein